MTKMTFKPVKTRGSISHYKLFVEDKYLGDVQPVRRKSAPSSDPHWVGSLGGSVPTTAVLPTRMKAAEALVALAASEAAKAVAPVKLCEQWRDLTKNPAVPEVSMVEMAFPATALDYLPPYDMLPDDFKERGDNAWMRLANTWFSNTQYLADHHLQLALKDDVDMEKLRKLIHVCMGSFAPKHEHKIGGVAYMLSRWCEDYALDGKFQIGGELVSAE